MAAGVPGASLIVFGVLILGIIGLFVGPIVLAVAWDLLVAFVRENDTALT